MTRAWQLLQNTLSQSYTVALLACLGQGTIGCAIAWLLEEELQLLDVTVDASHRRQGIAKKLMSSLTANAKDKGATRVTLEVSSTNVAAVKMYLGMGFKQVHVRKRYYQDGSDALLMDLGL